MSVHSVSRRGTSVQATLLLLIFSFGVAGGGSATAATCFVTVNGSGNGSSWAQAANLQTALVTGTCTEVWVKAGIYTPGGARTDSFSILPGVKVYGGFAGNETALDQRDPAVNLTTLSGDIGAPGDASDNSYHVVAMDGTTSAGIINASTVLDGFTVSGGNADSGKGAGLYCDGQYDDHECSPSITNVVFDSNRTGLGGAMYNDAFGGGISSPILSHVIFSNNEATYQGGAMFNNGSNHGTSSPSLSFVTFTGNHAAAGGGAMYNSALGSNSSGEVDQSVSSPSLSNVTFSGNDGGLNGGAMLTMSSGLNGSSEPSLSNVTFNGNHASNGGAVYNFSSNASNTPSFSTVTFSNVTFSDNTATNGGAMWNFAAGTSNSNPALSNVTFSNNSATQRGGAIYNYQTFGDIPVSPILNNVIAWGDSAGTEGAEIYNLDDTTTTINDSVVQGGCPADGSTTCSNVIDADPLLGALADNGGFTQTMLPGAGSSAIDAGNDSICATAPVNGIDQRGVARPQGPQCDIGSVEVAIDLIFRNGFDGS